MIITVSDFLDILYNYDHRKIVIIDSDTHKILTDDPYNYSDDEIWWSYSIDHIELRPLKELYIYVCT